MEITFNRRDMVKAMQMVIGAVRKSTALPILSHILISTGSPGEDKIYVTATDLEMGIRTSIPGRIIETGAIAIPAKTFANLINALSEDEVRMIALDKGVMICSLKGEFKIAGMSAGEFPSLMGETDQDKHLLPLTKAKGEEGICFSLPANTLKWMTEKTAFAAGRDESRHFLNGVYLLLKDTEESGAIVEMAATDGVRLAIANIAIGENIKLNSGVIIPNRTVFELKKLTEEPDTINVGFHENRITFSAGDTTLVSTLIEGNYPDYERLIPVQTHINLKLDAGKFLSAVKRIAQVANPKQPYVRLEVEGERLRVSANDPYVGDGYEEMDIDHEGDDIRVTFNAHYLMDALKTVETQEVFIGINGSELPVVIRPSAGDHLCVLMPIRMAE